MIDVAQYRFSHELRLGWEDFFHKNGFVVITNIFSSSECEEFLVALKKHAEPGFPTIHNIERDFPEGRELKEVELVVKNKIIVSMMDVICGSEVVALQNQILFKEAGSPYAMQAWNPHQDNSYPQTPNGEYTTTNIFLADADPENGGMYLYPGSHKEGLLPFEPTISYREKPGSNPGNTVKIPPQYKKLDLRVKNGDMLILHGHVIHGSYPNISKTRSRPLFSVSYLPRGIKFLKGKNNNRREIEVR